MADKRAYKQRARNSAYLAYHREYFKEWVRRWRRAALAALGGKCVRCGFTDERALQIDHVHGGGCRELNAAKSVAAFYRKVIAEAESGYYQLLCANCNWIKRYENDECAVKSKKDK